MAQCASAFIHLTQEKEANKTPETIEDRKSSWELRKYLLREIYPIQMYTPAASYDQEERQSRHSWKAHTSSSPEEGSQYQEIIKKMYTIEKVYASKHPNFTFKIKDPLSIVWDNSQRRFVLSCLQMKILLHQNQSADHYDPTRKPKTNLFLRLPGIAILDKKEILCLFLPAQKWAGMFHVFHIETSNGLILYFTKKTNQKQIIIPKGELLGYPYVIAQLQE